jgi:hypothetical protein
MANWKDQVVDLAGVVTTENVATHMDNAVKDVINKLARINPEMMHLFSSNVNNTSGNSYVSISDNNMIFKVARREGSVYRSCIEAPISLEADLQDDDSLNKATTEYPRFIRQNGQIWVFPTVTTANYISVTKVVYGTVNNVTGASDGSIDNFPSGMYPMVVCYAAMQTLYEKLAELNVQGSLQDLSLLEIDGNPITKDSWEEANNASAPTDAELENPRYFFSTLRHFINSEEDVELSRAQIEKISAYLNWYSTSMEHNKIDYTWMFDRLRQLKQNYNEFFLPYMPEQQREQNASN